MRFSVDHSLYVALATAFLCTLQLAATHSVADDTEELFCNTANAFANPNDYRKRLATPELKWGVADNEKYHLRPAQDRMRNGEYSFRVIEDLNFILIRWPNHYPALQALVAFEDGGGDSRRYNPIECYFEAARRLFPDDANVNVLLGLYLYRKGRQEDASETWQRALEIDPMSAEANYNLGLLYVRQAKYEAALPHAQAAYEAGYPLQGLKNKLIEAGHWQD